MRPTFDDAAPPEHREAQYFEMFVNRGIYHQGWTAVTRHNTPWVMACLPSTPTSGNCTAPTTGPGHDQAAEQPERLAHLQQLFLIEATKYNVLPLDDRRVERFQLRSCRPADPDPWKLAAPVQRDGPPVGELGGQHQEQVARGDGAAIPRESRRMAFWWPRRGIRRWTLYVKDGKPTYCYALFGLQRFKTYGDRDPRRRWAPGSDGVRLRRRWPRKRRLGDPVPRRREGRRRAGRAVEPMASQATKRPMSVPTRRPR